MSAVSVDIVSRAMEAVLSHEGRPVVYFNQAAGDDISVSWGLTASPIGLLPALVVAGEATWREATGHGFALDIVRDREALLGYCLRSIGAGSFTTLMLATMEAVAQVTVSGTVLASELGVVWSAATDRIERQGRLAVARTTGAVQ